MIPLGIAIILWGFSFHFGCLQIDFSLEKWGYMMKRLSLRRRKSKYTSEDYTKSYKQLNLDIKDTNEDIDTSSFLQLHFLIWGAICYLGRQLWEMILRTSSKLKISYFINHLK